ncbi:MAG: tetratricopeptide repeat protein [Cyanobacteriota bacterium]
MTNFPLDSQLKELQKTLAVRLAPLKVQVAGKADEVHVLVEYPSNQVPPRPQLVRQVASCLAAERLLGSKKFILYEQQAGQTQAEWCKVLRYSHQGSTITYGAPLAQQTELVTETALAKRVSEPKPVAVKHPEIVPIGSSPTDHTKPIWDGSPQLEPQPTSDQTSVPTATSPATPEHSSSALPIEPGKFKKLNAFWLQTQVLKQRRVQLALGAVLVGSLVGLGGAYKISRDGELAEQSYQQGLQQAQAERWQEAIEQYERGLRHRPRDPRLQAALLHAQNRIQQADRRIQEAQTQLAADPKNTVARLNLARAFYQQGNFSAAASELSTLLSFDSNHAPARFLLAEIHAAQGNLPQAIEQYRAALAVDPQLPSAQRQLGIALLSQGETEAALSALQTAISQNPNDAEAHYQLGAAYAQQENWDPVLRHNPTALGARAVLQVSVGGQAEREEQIAATLARQSTANPSRLGATPENQAMQQLRLQISLSRLQPNQTHAAPNPSEGERSRTQGQPTAPQLAQVLSPPTAATIAATPTYSPSETSSLSRGGWTWIIGGLLGIPSLLSLTWLAGRQLRHHRSAVAGSSQTSKDQASHYYSYALSLIEGGQLSQAIGALQQALSINPNMAPAHLRLGQLQIQTGQLQDGLEHLWLARRLDPGQLDIDTHLVKALLRQSQQLLSKRQPEAALESLKLALTLDIKSPEFQADIHQLRGEALAEQGEGSAALEALEQARKFNPKRAEVLVSIAKVKILQKQYSAAIDSCWGALALKDDLPEAHHQMGIALYRLGQLKAAIAAYRTAQILKAPATPALMTDYGLALVQTGDLAQAGQQFSQALLQDPGFAPAMYGVGTILMAQGYFAEAEQRFQQALELDPQLHVATAALGLLQLAQKQSDSSGKRFINSRQAEVAVHYFESSLRQDPDLPEAHFGLGELQRIKGNFISAAQRYQKALELNNSYVAAHYRLGSVQAHLGKLDLAIEEFRRALELNPHLPEAQKSLQKILSRQAEDVHTDILVI